MEEPVLVNSPLLPEKSKKRYESTYKVFKDWCQSKDNADVVTESLLLMYFQEKSSILKSPSSMWCEYSMLKTTIFINENIDISKYYKLRAFLKRQNAGYKPKKSNTFSREGINRFLEEAPDDKYLLMKVVLMMGIAGACRSHELCGMKLENVKDSGEIFIITIPDSKTGLSRMFIITEHLEKIKKYMELRSKLTSDSRRFFMRYQAGRCFNQPVGRNTFIEIPGRIARYLNLDNPETYTGRAFRRTSTILSANSGVGTWNFPSLIENYERESPIVHNEGNNQQFSRVDLPDPVVDFKEEAVSDNEVSSGEDNLETNEKEASSTNKISYKINDNEVASLSTNRCKEEIVINDNEFSSTEQNVKITKTENQNGNPTYVINVSNCSNCNLTININY